MKRRLLLFFVGLVLMFCFSCAKKFTSENRGKEQLVHLIPDSLLTPAQVELKKRIGEVIVKYVTIKDNKYVLSIRKREFINKGIPSEYYNLLKKNIKENNDFIRDNNIENVESLFNSMIIQLKRTYNVGD